MYKALIALSALPLVLALGCGGAQPAHATAANETKPTTETKVADAKAGDVKKNGEAKIGDKTTCPVSGEVFEVKADSPKTDHAGKTYYFCCPGCDKKFQADPKKYLDKAG